MMPEAESVYEWALDTETLAWVDWMATVPDFKCNPDRPFADIIVPTSDTVRYTHLMRHLLLAGHHVLAVGETGTGKTLAVQVCNSVLFCFCGVKAACEPPSAGRGRDRMLAVHVRPAVVCCSR
jgi:hypothetical protein